MSEQVNFISSGTTRSIKNSAPAFLSIGLPMATMGTILGFVTMPQPGTFTPGIMSAIGFGVGIFGFILTIGGGLASAFVNAQQRDSYRQLSALLEKSLISSWNGDASAFSKIYSSFPPVGAFPDYECISVDTEQYYDIPETWDAVAFKKELLDEFYRRIFESQIDDIRVINLGGSESLHFTMPHGYRTEGTTVKQATGSDGFPIEGSYGWYGYVFYWIDVRNSGKKISWTLKKAMLDELGWNAGDPSRAKLIGLRDFLLECLAEAYRSIIKPDKSQEVKEGVREARTGRRVRGDDEDEAVPLAS